MNTLRGVIRVTENKAVTSIRNFIEAGGFPVERIKTKIRNEIKINPEFKIKKGRRIVVGDLLLFECLKQFSNTMDSTASRIHIGEIEHLKAKVVENCPDRIDAVNDLMEEKWTFSESRKFLYMNRILASPLQYAITPLPSISDSFVTYTEAALKEILRDLVPDINKLEVSYKLYLGKNYHLNIQN